MITWTITGTSFPQIIEEEIEIKIKRRYIQPNVTFYPTTYEFQEVCMVEEFFKNNPNGTCMIACPCRKCRVYC